MADRPVLPEAGPSETEEIEVTPEMVRAGTDSYYEYWFAEPEDRMEFIFRAMFAAMKR